MGDQVVRGEESNGRGGRRVEDKEGAGWAGSDVIGQGRAGGKEERTPQGPRGCAGWKRPFPPEEEEEGRCWGSRREIKGEGRSPEHGEVEMGRRGAW